MYTAPTKTQRLSGKEKIMFELLWLIEIRISDP